MEPQSGSDEPDQRRLRIEFDPGKIAVALEIPFALMPAHAQPVIHRLHRQLDIFRSFQFDHHEASSPRHTQQVEYAAIARGQRRNLRIEMARIELGVEAGGILAAPASRSSAPAPRDRGVIRVGGERRCDTGPDGASSGRAPCSVASLNCSRESPRPKEIPPATIARTPDRENKAPLRSAGRHADSDRRPAAGAKPAREIRSMASRAACSAASASRRGMSQLSRFPASAGSIFCICASGSRNSNISVRAAEESARTRWPRNRLVPSGTNNRSPSMACRSRSRASSRATEFRTPVSPRWPRRFHPAPPPAPPTRAILRACARARTARKRSARGRAQR